MDAECVVGRFELLRGASPAALSRALRRAGYVVGRPTISRDERLFVETQDGRLAKAQCRLSLCRTGRGRVWRFAGPDGESETPFEGDFPFRSVSPDAAGIPVAARVLAGNRLLLPLVRLRAFVSTSILQAPSGGALELGVERFMAAPPWENWPKGPWRYGLLTIRLLDGPSDAFLHVTTYLRDRLGLIPSSGDACQAALQALALPPPGAPLPDHLRIRLQDSLSLAARKIVGQQTLKMRANVRGTLDDVDPEYLHDLRVATRRLRSALRLFDDVLGPGRCNALRRRLRWVARLLGGVRDLDVFIANLQAQAQRLAEAGTIATLLADELRRQRAPAREALSAALTSRRFGALLRRLDALASSPPPRRPRGAQGLSVAEAAPALIRKGQTRMLRFGRALGAEPAAADLHRLRILFKRLRYTGEFFRAVFVDPASGQEPLADYIAVIVRLQDCLGEHQDAVVAIPRIQALANEMVQRGVLERERLLDLGSLIQVQREIVRERRVRLRKLWGRFDRRSIRQCPAALNAHAPPPSQGEAPVKVTE